MNRQPEIGPEIDDVDLHAYIDGELDAERRAAVAAGIDADPALAERVAAFRADKEMLRRIYGRAVETPMPAEWQRMIESAKVARPVSWRLVGSIAAAIVIGVIGTVAVQKLQPQKAGEIVSAALDARAGGVNGATPAESTADARHFADALSRTIALPVKVPDMRRLGYRLVGMHLYPRSGGGAAELLYRGADNQLFTLYVRRSDGKTRFDQFERNGLRVCVWQDEEVGTVMAGNVSTAAMQRLASLAYTGLTL